MTPEHFLHAHVHTVSGATMPVADAYHRFLQLVPACEKPAWTLKRFVRELRELGALVGRRTRDGVTSLGNAAWRPREDTDPVLRELTTMNGWLRPRPQRTPRRNLQMRLLGW